METAGCHDFGMRPPTRWWKRWNARKPGGNTGAAPEMSRSWVATKSGGQGAVGFGSPWSAQGRFQWTQWIWCREWRCWTQRHPGGFGGCSRDLPRWSTSLGEVGLWPLPIPKSQEPSRCFGTSLVTGTSLCSSLSQNGCLHGVLTAASPHHRPSRGAADPQHPVADEWHWSSSPLRHLGGGWEDPRSGRGADMGLTWWGRWFLSWTHFGMEMVFHVLSSVFTTGNCYIYYTILLVSFALCNLCMNPNNLTTCRQLKWFFSIFSHHISPYFLHISPAQLPRSQDTGERSNPSVRFARRLPAVANPTALASAEAARDPLAALAFLCPEEGSMVEAGWCFCFWWIHSHLGGFWLDLPQDQSIVLMGFMDHGFFVGESSNSSEMIIGKVAGSHPWRWNILPIWLWHSQPVRHGKIHHF